MTSAPHEDRNQELHALRNAALDAQRAAAVQRQRDDGALTARARIALLLDDEKSFVEYGRLARPRQRSIADAPGVDAPGVDAPGVDAPGVDAPADGVVIGVGRIHRQPAVVIAWDITAGGGTRGVVNQGKLSKALSLARQLSAPLILLADGGGFRDAEVPHYRDKRDAIAQLATLCGQVPMVGVAFGAVRDEQALMVSLCDTVIATVRASLDVTSGRAIASAADCEKAGSIDLLCDGDEAAIKACRDYLQFFLQFFVESAIASAAGDDSEIKAGLRAIVPDNPRRAIDARRLIALLADAGSTLNLRTRFGGAIQTVLGRIGGRATGFIANHSMVGAGAIDADAADKMARFIALCDRFGLPLVFLCDTPGLLAGPRGEASAMNRHSTRPFFQLARTRVPLCTIIVRRAYGQGQVLMGTLGTNAVNFLHLVWPTAEFGGMGLGGAAAIVKNSSSAQQSGDMRSENDVQRELMRYGSPIGMAERFQTDDMIEPDETRDRLLAAFALLPETVSRPASTTLDTW